jgi:hypothetical protein
MEMPKYLAGCLFLLFLVAACSSTKPVYNVDAAPLNAPATATMDDIQNAIIRAGAGRGWQMRPDGEGHLVATLSVRSHFAAADIYFDKQRYSILYQQSENLDYDGSNIHNNYNKWIRTLQSDISNQMAVITFEEHVRHAGRWKTNVGSNRHGALSRWSYEGCCGRRC